MSGAQRRRSRPGTTGSTCIWLAASLEAASLKGEYVSKRKPVTPQKQALDAKLAADLLKLDTA
jgi:retinol dehydrogenase-12